MGQKRCRSNKEEDSSSVEAPPVKTDETTAGVDVEPVAVVAKSIGLPAVAEGIAQSVAVVAKAVGASAVAEMVPAPIPKVSEPAAAVAQPVVAAAQLVSTTDKIEISVKPLEPTQARNVSESPCNFFASCLDSQSATPKCIGSSV